MVPYIGEFMRRRALEREDRLFLVANREQRAAYVFARTARQEFGDENLYDFPLLVACVLRLSAEHVVDAEVELVEPPSRCRAFGGGVAQELECLVDQVIIIEQAAAL